MRLLLVASLVFSSATSFASTIRTIEFSASDFRTQQDNPVDFRSIGNPFGIFGLTQPSQITGSIVYDTQAPPQIGPVRLNAGDELEFQTVFLPFINLSFVLGPAVELNALQFNHGDTVAVLDGIGTKTSDNLFFQSSTDQLLSGGIRLTAMQIQFTAEPKTFSGLDVPSPEVINSIVNSMPDFDEKLRVNMFDAQGNFHSLVAFDMFFSEIQAVTVPEPSSFALIGLGFAVICFSRKKKAA